MTEIKGVSIWDNIPDDWQEEQPAVVPPAVSAEVESAPEEVPPAEPVPVELPPEEPVPEELIPEEASPQKPVRAKKSRKLEKEKLQEYQRKDEESRRNASESTRNAYRAEHRGNRRDFIILGAVLFVAACIIAALLFASSQLSTERVYDLIEQGNYSTAYQSLSELSQKEKNIDQLVYTFCEACVEDSEYKRAVAALEYLSEAAQSNPAFFAELVETLLSHQKQNRAQDVLNYMYTHGETLSQLADQLVQKHTQLQ